MAITTQDLIDALRTHFSDPSLHFDTTNVTYERKPQTESTMDFTRVRAKLRDQALFRDVQNIYLHGFWQGHPREFQYAGGDTSEPAVIILRGSRNTEINRLWLHPTYNIPAQLQAFLPLRVAVQQDVDTTRAAMPQEVDDPQSVIRMLNRVLRWVERQQAVAS